MHVNVIGSAGRPQTRTSFEIGLVIGVPFSRWGARPFVVHPTQYPVSQIKALLADNSARDETTAELRHPIHIALTWQKDLTADNDLTMADIARNKGISRARVSQIMSLLRLPEAIQEELVTLAGAGEIRFLSERQLRGLLTLGSQADRIKAFQEMRDCFQNRCAK